MSFGALPGLIGDVTFGAHAAHKRQRFMLTPKVTEVARGSAHPQLTERAGTAAAPRQR
jgi:hypothetical protein